MHDENSDLKFVKPLTPGVHGLGWAYRNGTLGSNGLMMCNVLKHFHCHKNMLQF